MIIMVITQVNVSALVTATVIVTVKPAWMMVLAMIR